MAASISSLAAIEALDDELEIGISAAIAVVQNLNICSTAIIINDVDDEERNSSAHVENYVEVTVPRYTNIQFREHFRMGTVVYEEFLRWIAPSMPKERTISIEKYVLATLWYLGNLETYRSIAYRFGMIKGSLRRVVITVCRILVSRIGEFIIWPDETRMKRNAEEFAVRCGFPGVIGALDGTHIRILCPKDFRDAYIDRTGAPSMQLQVVCDFNLLFLDIFTGYPGSVHDARVWRNCPLKTKLQEEGLPPNYHLLGDSAYPLDTYLMVPFRNDGHLDRGRVRYNSAHSSTRVEVERSIGLLKGKWRRLKFLEMLNVEDMSDVIAACCFLHNYVITSHGIDEDQIDASDGENVDVNVVEEGAGNLHIAAEDKRAEILYTLVG